MNSSATKEPANAPSPQLAERTPPGLHSFLISRLPSIRPDANILDLGCGTGAWLERLSRAGFSNLFGIDHDVSAFASRVAVAKQGRIGEGAFPFPDMRFGLITAVEVIEHLENIGALYQIARDHLTEDGYLLVTTPNIHSLVSRLRHLLTGRLGQFDEKGDLTHIAPMLLDGTERIVPRYGLKIVARWGYPERSSVIYRPAMAFAARLLRVVLPDNVPGDQLCLLFRRAS